MRLRRMRKSIHFTQGTKHKVVPKKVTADVVKDVKYLYLPLFDAERSWAYAMELKSESNTEPRKKFHMLNRLKKAVEHASDLQMIVSDEHLPCDALTKLEANAYCCWMKGLLEFERQDWKNARDNFSKSKVIYEKLADTVVGDAKEIYSQRCSEISPNMRYCEYNIGDSSAIEDLMQMRLNVGSEDPLTSKLDELIEKTREKQSQSLSEVSWLGRIIPVRNLNVRRVLMNLQQDNKQVSEAAIDQKLSMCESHLKEIIEAQQSLKDDFKDDANFKNAIIKGQAHEGPVSDPVYLFSYLSFLKQTTTVERNLLMVQSIKNLKPEDTKKGRPQDFARLYDSIIQNFSEVLLLPGLEGKRLLDDVQVQITGYKALRCFHIGQSYVSIKKWKEAMALYDRSLKYASDALVAYQKTSLDNKKVESAISELKELMANIEGLKYFVHASCIINDQEVGVAQAKPVNLTKPVVERLHEYAELPTNNLKKLSLMSFPPDFEPIPAKPFFFDLALSLVQFPALDDRLEQKKTQGGFTGYFKKWIWGGESGDKQ